MNQVKRFIASVLLVPCFLWSTACSQSEIAALTNVLGTDAANIAKVEGNAALASKLTADTAAAVAAINEWKSGTPAAEAIEALNLVEDDLALFPGSSQYAPLIVLAIGTVDSILALLPQSATPAVKRVALAHPLQNPPKTVREFRKQWKATAKAHGLSVPTV